MRLHDLPLRTPATVTSVDDHGAQDGIARRLRELGFVPGEPLSLVACGPLGGDPLLVRIGSTRFALRHSEAARILVQVQAAPA